MADEARERWKQEGRSPIEKAGARERARREPPWALLKLPVVQHQKGFSARFCVTKLFIYFFSVSVSFFSLFTVQYHLPPLDSSNYFSTNRSHSSGQAVQLTIYRMTALMFLQRLSMQFHEDIVLCPDGPPNPVYGHSVTADLAVDTRQWTLLDSY